MVYHCSQYYFEYPMDDEYIHVQLNPHDFLPRNCLIDFNGAAVLSFVPEIKSKGASGINFFHISLPPCFIQFLVLVFQFSCLCVLYPEDDLLWSKGMVLSQITHSIPRLPTPLLGYPSSYCFYFAVRLVYQF